MNTRRLSSMIAVVLSGALACGGSSPSPSPDSGTPDSGTPDSGTPDGGVVTAECDKAANVARKAQLIAAQPVLAVKSKAVITATTTFASVAGDATVSCPVDLKFRDLNANGTLDAYEDWTRSAQDRATDLATRMSADQKLALMAHATTTDAPTVANSTVSTSLQAAVTAGVRFGATSANGSALKDRATWANNLQALCEASSLGVPFVLSTEPAHSQGNGHTRARGYSQWPQELGLGALGDLAAVENFGKVVSIEYRAIGIRMALSPSADLATEPRWFNNQFTFGEDSASVAATVGAYVKGLQGASLGPTSVAAVVSHFPGAGPAQGGFDARLVKGKYVVYPGNAMDAHLAAFQGAFANNVAGVMPAYGISQTGAWSALGGTLVGTTLEQVGASFNKTLLTDILRTHYAFSGLVLAPPGVLEDTGTSPLGAPWGMESSTKAQRIAKAVNAGVDQFGGLNDTTALAAAKSGALITDVQVDAAAKRALALTFQLGLFENPYVDPVQAPALCNTDAAYRAGLDAMDRSMVLLLNAAKPTGWLNGSGNGSQTADSGNAGNGSGLVLPAPPGQVYVAAGCRFYIGAGNFDLDYVRSVSAGYGELTNDETIINNTAASTEADKMALSDYVFIRISAPYSVDPDSGPLNYCKPPLQYSSNDNAAALQPIRDARAAIAARAGSQTQIVVGIDSGRPSVVSELVGLGVSGIYLEWGVTDKVFLDVAFGIVNGKGKLPAGVPLSDAAATTQKEDVAVDGQHATFIKGFGLQTTAF